MKRIMSPAFFAVVVICFFLPFVSISCDTSALQEGFGDAGEEVGAEDPFGGGIPGVTGGGGEIEIAKGTGLDIVLGSSIEPEGFGPLGGLGQVDPEAEEGSWGDLDGRLFVILALAAAVLGLGLSLLRDRLGGAFAALMGIAGVALLVMFRAVASVPDVDDAAQIGPGADVISLNFEIGWMLASAAFVLAAASGIWVAMTGTGAPQAQGVAPPPAEPPPPSGEPPPPSGEPPPPA